MPLKANSDEALKTAPPVKKVVVVNRTDTKIRMKKGRDFCWHDLMNDAGNFFEPEHMDSADMLFILYTSGTTGKPKGVVPTTGGY